MKRTACGLFAFVLVLTFGFSSVAADTIEKGTMSLSGWSSINFDLREYDWDEGVDEEESNLRLNFTFGYFPLDNFEVGAGGFFKRENREYSDFTSYGVRLLAKYHYPVGENVNLFLRAGINGEKEDLNRDNYSDRNGYGFGYSFAAGPELFLNRYVSVFLQLIYFREYLKFDREDSTIDIGERLVYSEIGADVGISVYF